MITKLCFTILTLISISSTAQINGAAVPERLVIEYWNQWYPFGQEGKYHTSEIFEFNCKGEIYSLDTYQTIEKSLRNDSVNKSTRIHRDNLKVSIELMTKLLYNLSNNSIPLEFNDKEKRKFVEERNIRELRRIAKEVDNKWFFDELDREDIKEIKSIISSDSIFDKFINRHVNYQYIELHTVDYSNQARFTLFYNTDTIVYDIYIDNLLAQPFIRRSNTGIDEYVFNAKINEILKLILPKQSLLSERLQLDYCKRGYLLWILDNY